MAIFYGFVNVYQRVNLHFSMVFQCFSHVPRGFLRVKYHLFDVHLHDQQTPAAAVRPGKLQEATCVLAVEMAEKRDHETHYPLVV